MVLGPHFEKTALEITLKKWSASSGSLRVAPHSHLGLHISHWWPSSLCVSGCKCEVDQRTQGGDWETESHAAELWAGMWASGVVCPQETLLFCRGSEPCCILYSQSGDAWRAEWEQRQDRSYDYLCSFRRDGHPFTLLSLLSRGHQPAWPLFCMWADKGYKKKLPEKFTRKNYLEFSFFVPLWAQYLAFWFGSDFNNKAFPLSVPFLPKSKGGAHEAHLSLWTEKLPFIEWGKGWKPEGADSPKWIEGGYVGALCCASLHLGNSSDLPPSIRGPGLLPYQDREILYGENFYLHWALSSGMFVLRLLIGFLTLLSSLRGSW